MIRTAFFLLALAWAAGFPVAGQESQPAEKKQEEKKDKSKPEPFVLTGTVFTEQSFALPGAKIRVRRSGEKKVRGEAFSDRRGEFGIRLPEGPEYEMTVEAKGYETVTRKFTAQRGAVSNLVFKMKPASGGKP